MIKWRAVYKEEDGTISKRFFFDQFDGDKENRYEDIERTRLGRFDIFNEDELVHSVYLHDNQRLIFRRRNFISVGDGSRSQVIIVGWVETVQTPGGSRDIYSLTYIFEDGNTVHDNHRDNLELIPQEK